MNLGGFHGLKDVCNSLGLTQKKKVTCVYTHAGNEKLRRMFSLPQRVMGFRKTMHKKTYKEFIPLPENTAV